MKRVLLSLACGLTAAVIVYALVRAGQALSGGEANPATVIVRGQHLAYFWRALTSVFGGAIGAVCAYLVADRHAARLARALVPALTVALVLLGLQVLFLP